jgi:hypothetical protein
MKKMILGFALVCFVAFGTFSIQSAMAVEDNVEIVKMNFDDDPDKNKKAEAKTDGKDKKGECSKESKAECKDASTKCVAKKECCPSKATKCGDKKSGGDKK